MIEFIFKKNGHYLNLELDAMNTRIDVGLMTENEANGLKEDLQEAISQIETYFPKEETEIPEADMREEEATERSHERSFEDD